MSQQRNNKIDQIFQTAVAAPPENRPALLDRLCADDAELRNEVEALLKADKQASGFFTKVVSKSAAQLIEKDSPQFAANEKISHYRIEREIGRGGMGEVYLAYDTSLNRPVALKLLSKHLTTDIQRVRRFRQEALAASALNHPNIITVYEINEDGDRPFIATEYVNGVTLRTQIRGKRLSLSMALDIAIHVATALVAAHEAGIVHRDIKPENIMIRPDGLIKVLDFGIAKHGPPPHEEESWVKTATGAIIGTAAYMSPEHARGLVVDARTDIWSLGVILYEMISHRLPFPGKTPADRVAAILEREPPSISSRQSNLPDELDGIIRRALAKDRDKRYARVSDFAQDLRKVRATLAEQPAFRFNLPTTKGASYFSKRMIAVAAILLVVMSVGAALYFRSRNQRAAIESIAVLPLVNTEGSADADYLADGITENVINSLSQLPNLKIISRNSVFRYKGQEVDVKKVRDAFNVNAALTGRLTQRGDDLLVTLELVDTRDESHLWGGHYSRKLAEVGALENEIFTDIAQQLRTQVSGSPRQSLSRKYSDNPEAYQLYLKGRYHLLKHTRDEIQLGIDYFRRAIDADPSNALAYTGLADAYMVEALPGESRPSELLPLAKAAAAKAISIDTNLAEGHVVLGYVVFFYEWNWSAAESEFRRALELDPNNADAHQSYGDLLSYTGRHNEALSESRRARELDPLNLRTDVLEAGTLVNAGKPDEALARLKQTLELDPNYWFAHQWVATAYIEKGMFAEAILEARKALETQGVSSRPTALLGYALAKSGKHSEAQTELNKLLKLSQARFVSPYNIALIYSALEQRNDALAWLERGYNDRDPRMVFLKIDTKLNNLRSDPRFQDLLRRVGFNS
jgi:serine/threonine protein kinase/Tfp pilus assembly protein PilF